MKKITLQFPLRLATFVGDKMLSMVDDDTFSTVLNFSFPYGN
jgi:hypothetical protein